jgi:Asp/Glu/hydantoin racemase
MKPRIALVHATPLAMAPIEAAFRAGWPEAQTMNILDDTLSADRARQAALDAATFTRFERLARYAVDYGARAVLFTCSAFGPAIEAAARSVKVPVLKPNEAMFDAALAIGDRIGLVATFAPSVASMVAEFEQAAAAAGRRATIRTALAEGAMESLRDGDARGHDARVAEAAATLTGVDAIMLAQFSMARALDAARARVDVPVLTSPESAVAKLRARVEA